MSEAVVETPERADIAAVADNFVSLMRAFTKARARILAAAEHDVEWSAQIVLRFVANEGPVRASAVAEGIQSDPSTVSRQVASLVKEGLLERRADQGDGRASLLVVTEKAQAVLSAHDEIRLNHFADMLVDWTATDLRRFASLLAKFTDDYERSSELTPLSGKAIRRPNPAGRNA